MKTLEITILVEVEDDVHTSDIFLNDHDVCDGYELLRMGNDNTEVFKLHDGYIKNIKKLKNNGN